MVNRFFFNSVCVCVGGFNETRTEICGFTCFFWSRNLRPVVVSLKPGLSGGMGGPGWA